jgi:hypothetical protein
MSEVIIEIDTHRWDIKEQTLRRALNAFPEKAIEGASLIVFNTLKPNTPVRTGRLQASETRQVFGKRAIIRTNTGYGKFVDEGIGPSPGRYVPAIGKRIRSGTHPGFPGRHFKDKTLQISYPRIKDFIQNLAQSEFP